MTTSINTKKAPRRELTFHCNGCVNADLASIEAALIDRIALALPCFGLRSFQSTNDLGVSGLPYPMLDANDMKSAGIV